MNSSQRRKIIAQLLENSTHPISATTLAMQFDVSRQVIVGDIALLRASGVSILATPRGYIITPNEENEATLLHTIACNHGIENVEKEIYAIVDNGGGLVDVIVEHPIYGQLTGQLNIFSRFDADEFIKSTKQHSATLLSNLTDGVHLHTIFCKDEDVFRRIVTALEREGVLLKN